MDRNNKKRKVKSAKKNHNLKINNNKIFNIKNKLIQSNNHNSNKKAVDKIKNIANNVNKKQRLFSSNINSNIKIKEDFEAEYNKLENLCSKQRKKDKKDIINIKKYIEERKIKFKKNEEEKNINKLNYYKKMFKNYQNLEKEIKMINRVNKLEEKKEKEKEIKKLDNNLNEKSNGSFENNKFNNNYYFGCLDVKRILKKNIPINNKNTVLS